MVTVNDYLARRDSEWVGQVPRFLGLSVAVIQSGDDEEARRAAYRSDITYITNSELGFGGCPLLPSLPSQTEPGTAAVLFVCPGLLATA